VIILRYLGKEIYKTMFFTVVVLLLILLTNQLVNLLNRAVMGRMPAMTVIQAVTLGIPQYLAYIIPLAIFLAIIVVLGKMSSSHELGCMHASGLSKGQLLRNIILIALPVFSFVALLTFELVPLSSNLEQVIIQQAAMKITLDKVIPGQFQPLSGLNTMFHSEEKKEDALHDVLLIEIVQKNNAKKFQAPVWDVTRADRVSQKTLDHSPYLIFQDGHRVIMQPGALEAEEFQFSEYGIYTPLPEVEKKASVVGLSTADLWDHRRDNLKYLAEWQWRLSIPLSVLIFAGIAFPLSRVSPRQGKFMRVLPAVLIYALYVSLLFASRSWIQDAKIQGWIGLWWVPIASIAIVLGFFVVTYLKSSRIRKWHD
jgi:lipopolysaccharide export system permease protein